MIVTSIAILSGIISGIWMYIKEPEAINKYIQSEPEFLGAYPIVITSGAGGGGSGAVIYGNLSISNGGTGISHSGPGTIHK